MPRYRIVDEDMLLFEGMLPPSSCLRSILSCCRQREQSKAHTFEHTPATVLSALSEATAQHHEGSSSVRLLECSTSLGNFMDVRKQGSPCVPDTSWPLVREVFKVTQRWLTLAAGWLCTLCCAVCALLCLASSAGWRTCHLHVVPYCCACPFQRAPCDHGVRG
jgi:hypothetical protein